MLSPCARLRGAAESTDRKELLLTLMQQNLTRDNFKNKNL